MREYRIGLAVAVMALAIVFIAVGSEAQQQTPPEVRAGHNMISVLCNVDAEALAELEAEAGLEFFTYNGSEYEPARELRRGYGYILRSRSDLMHFDICDTSSTDNRLNAISLHRGWNLLGNPVENSISIDEILGGLEEGGVAGRVFYYRDGAYRAMGKSESAAPGEGVWVYAYFPAPVVPPYECDSITVEMLSPDTETVPVGEEMDFEAVCIIGEQDGEEPGGDCDDTRDEEDCGGEEGENVIITDIADWSVSDTSVLETGEDEGSFVAVSEGEADVTASLGYVTGNAVTVTVEGMPPALESISLSAGEYELEAGEVTELTVTGAYTGGTSEEITEEAEIESLNAVIGTVEDAVFTAVSEGDVVVTAQVGELTSSITIHVVEPPPAMEEIFVSVWPSTIEIYETAWLSAHTIYSNGSYEDLTDEVTWVFDPDAGELEEGGRFYPSRIGRVEFTATLDDASSETVSLSVIEKKLIWLGIFPDYDEDSDFRALECPDDIGYAYCYNNAYLHAGESGVYFAAAHYNNGSYGHDVLDSIEMWESSDQSVATVDDGVITAHETGLVAIRAYMEGVYSEWSWVQVVDDSTERFLILEYSNSETIVEAGGEIPLNATYYQRYEDGGTSGYPSYFSGYIDDGEFGAETVTAAADWHLSDPAPGGFDKSRGMFSGNQAGRTDIHAEYDGLESNTINLEVWEPAELDICEAAGDDQSAQWTDGVTIARLDADCSAYERNESVNLVFDAQHNDNDYHRVLDVCLDLYIYNSDEELVKTIRHENCSPTPLFRQTQGYTPVYSYGFSWNQDGDDGEPAPPGEYTAVARFYVLYCPILKVHFEIVEE